MKAVEKFKAIFDSLNIKEQQLLLTIETFGENELIISREEYEVLQGLQRLPRNFLRKYGIEKKEPVTSTDSER